MVAYSEILETQGVRIPFDPAIITPKIERPIRNDRYEKGECALLRRVLRAGDRVLELGGGLGLLSTVAARTPGIAAVTTIEANPALIPLIRETHRLNGVTGVDLRNAVATAAPAGPVPFYIRADFWASSMEPDSRPYVQRAEVPAAPIAALVAELSPTVISCDIEGGELGLFDAVDLSGVRALILELHPKVYGEAGLARIHSVLAAHGFARVPTHDASSVQMFERAPAAAIFPGTPPRQSRAWPIRDPRVFVATCMKDEGPFILEWIAWHKAVGVTDFVVFTNDCSDGTDAILDRLEALGHLRHLPNPALATGATAFQPIALSYACHLREMAQADFFVSMDVDEFLNIRVGGGTLPDLFAATGPFDVLSMSELNHGANGQEHYARGWVTDLFPGHQTATPGKHKAHRGVKSIVRLSDRVEKLRNHRPDLRTDVGPVLWLDGSGRVRPELHADPTANGFDCRGSYDLVSLDHFPLRSLDSYLVKMLRGDVVVAGKRVSLRYWRMRNFAGETTSRLDRVRAAALAVHAELLADPELARLHEAACAAHEARIAELVEQPEFKARRDQILREAW